MSRLHLRSVSRFRINDLHPYIYRTQDGGKSWTTDHHRLAGDRAGRHGARRSGAQGTCCSPEPKTRVWVSFDDGDHWQSLQLNLPHTSMRDLWIHENDLIVATHGRAFWILDDISPLRRCNCQLRSAAHLFTPAPAYRVRRDTNTDTPLPPDEPAGAESSGWRDYRLLPAESAASPVTLEILDGQGQLVRRYSSKDKPDITEEESAEATDSPLLDARLPKALRRMRACIAGFGICTILRRRRRGMNIRLPRFRTTPRAIRWARCACREITRCGSR